MTGVYDQPMTLPAAIIGVVNALLVLVAAFGVTISQAQQAAVTVFANALLVAGAVIYDYWRRRKPTTPPAAG
jgi:hypothetical protein